MQWVLAIVMAVLGTAFGGAGSAPLGLVGGTLVGWLLGTWIEAKRRISHLERDLEDLRSRVTVARTSDAMAAAAARAETRPADREAPTSATGGNAMDPARAAAVAAASVPNAAAIPAAVPGQAPASSPASTPARPIAARDGLAPANRAVFTASEPAGIEPAAGPTTSNASADAAAAAAAANAAASTASASRTGAATPAYGTPRVDGRNTVAPPTGGGFGDAIRRWFTEGNVPVKIGIVVFLFGIGAALKYAADQGWMTMPIEYRLAGIALLGVVGLVLGWRQRHERRAFALSMQGGAIGVMLLTVFAAYGMYKVLPAGAAFAMVLVLVAGAALLAVLQDAPALAALGFFGGYLAPVLIRTGNANHVALFSYYAVLNAAVFGIAFAKPWRALNLIGFLFTFVVGLAWGDRFYRPEHFATVEPFLIAFFLFYVGIAVLYALKQPKGRRGLVDGSITFGAPLLAFPLQAAMLRDEPIALAYSALAVAVLYGGLAWWLIKRRGIVVLGQAFAVLAVGFATLAVPLALSARWTATTWAIEGAALVWLGLRQQRLLPRVTGFLLQIAAAFAYIAGIWDEGWRTVADDRLILNGHFFSLALIAFAGFATSWLYDRANGHRAIVWLAFLWAWWWWTIAGAREIVVHDEAFPSVAAMTLAFVVVTMVLAALARRLLDWRMPDVVVLAGTLTGFPMVLAVVAGSGHPFGQQTAVWWLAWLVTCLGSLRALRDPAARALAWMHVVVLATVAFIAGLEAMWRVQQMPEVGGAWIAIALIAPLALLLIGTHRLPALFAWPLADRYPEYSPRWEVPAAAALALAWLASLFNPGDPAPLSFLPILNPLELLQVAGLVFVWRAALARGSDVATTRLVGTLATLLLLTMMTLRAVHHLYGEPWSIAILDSRLAQTALTVVWATLGVSAWIYGSRKLQRGTWMAGAIVIGIVLVKLVLVDRQYIGNLAGVVSFLAVGLLMIAVGYFAPSPPRERAPEAA